MEESFWTNLDLLLQSTELVIDRPRGSSHPRYPSLVYPLDYGYLKETSGGDGNELDIWRGTCTDAKLDALVCTVDHLKKDVEVKFPLIDDNTMDVAKKYGMIKTGES